MPVWSRARPPRHIAASIGSTENSGSEKCRESPPASVLFPEPGSPAKTMSFCGIIGRSCLRQARKSPARSFPGYLRFDRQRVHGSPEFRLQRRIDHAMAFDPALPFEGRRHNIEPEMRLAARPVPGMALMQMRFVDNVEAFGHESFTQLLYDIVFGAHDGGRYACGCCPS